jgi:hypothetical protein
VAPFLDAAAFVVMLAPETLTSGEYELATPLLQVVSDWIRDKKPGIADDDPAAIVVSFEVVRDALLSGKFGPFTSFAKTMGPRSRSATIDREALSKFVTGRHRLMLGLGAKAAPRGNFLKCDY